MREGHRKFNAVCDLGAPKESHKKVGSCNLRWNARQWIWRRKSSPKGGCWQIEKLHPPCLTFGLLASKWKEVAFRHEVGKAAFCCAFRPVLFSQLGESFLHSAVGQLRLARAWPLLMRSCAPWYVQYKLKEALKTSWAFTEDEASSIRHGFCREGRRCRRHTSTLCSTCDLCWKMGVSVQLKVWIAHVFRSLLQYGSRSPSRYSLTENPGECKMTVSPRAWCPRLWPWSKGTKWNT